jgi:GT2 family glycosyltransferase
MSALLGGGKIGASQRCLLDAWLSAEGGHSHRMIETAPRESKATSMTATETSHKRGALDDESPRISVIVPTRNRPDSVARAVRSALNQALPAHEVVVVVDGPDSATVGVLEDIGDSRVVIIELAENGGAARARNIGVSNSKGEWVAFLDDDDEWLPGKLRAQAISAVSGTDVQHLVLATGVERKRDSASDWWPLRSPSPQERVSDYLFVRRRPGEGFLQTSTIMLRREFAMARPFPEHLQIHEDYDWFIELDKAGARFQVVLEPLVIFNAQSARTSLSSNVQWETSLAWALSRKSDMSQRAFSDFCLTEVARAARATGGSRAEVAVFFVALAGRLSWFSTARFLAICLLPADARRRMAGKAGPSVGQAATGAP